MPTMRRKPGGSRQLTVQFTFKEGPDDDLIEFIEQIPPRQLARILRQALRSGVCAQTPPTEPKEPEVDLSGLGFDLD